MEGHLEDDGKAASKINFTTWDICHHADGGQ